jgi:hypothetical protein
MVLRTETSGSMPEYLVQVARFCPDAVTCNLLKGLKFSEENNANFEIAGADKKFYPASLVKIKGNSIEISANL